MKLNEIFDIKFTEFIEQIKSCNKQKDTSGILLFKDYLSKMNVWNEKMKIYNDWVVKVKRNNDALNLVSMGAPNLLNDIISIYEFKSNYFKSSQFDLSSRGIDAELIYAYLCWEIFKDNPQFKEYKDLPNPYEAIRILLSRGNHIRRGEMGAIVIDFILQIRLQTDFNLPSLDYDFLDYIDEICVRSGSGGIPNQERTNQLWEEFQQLKQNG